MSELVRSFPRKQWPEGAYVISVTDLSTVPGAVSRFHGGPEWINEFFFLDLWASDKGTYICEAENQFGKIQSQTTVTVTGLGKIN